MFRDLIRGTSLTTPFAEEYFRGKIWGDTVNGDSTFISTLRALVAPRLGEDDHLTFSYYSQSMRPSDVRSKTEETIANDQCVHVNHMGDGILFIKNISTGSDEASEKVFHAIENNLESMCAGWHRVTKVTDFYRKVFKVLCYVNVERRSVYIFTDNMDTRRMHYLQCGVFAFLPWYFDPKNGVSDEEMSLIHSLREKTPDRYLECVDQIASHYDFRTAGIKGMLAGFELKYERLRRQEVSDNIAEIDRMIIRLNDEIGDYLRQRRDKEIMLLGIETKLASGDEESEIMQYFINNRKLSLMKVDDTVMDFVVKDYLQYFDEDAAESMINNKRSLMYRPNDRGCNNIIPEEDMEKLMRAVFIDQTIKIKFCAAYHFRLEGNVSALGGYEYGSEFRDYMPNTHIDAYNCLGNYERQINMFLRNRDYIGAIEQCIASCKSLNFGDGTVMREFFKRIYGISDYSSQSTNNKCFELPDGSVVRPKEAIEYLKQQEGEVTANGESD